MILDFSIRQKSDSAGYIRLFKPLHLEGSSPNRQIAAICGTDAPAAAAVDIEFNNGDLALKLDGVAKKFSFQGAQAESDWMRLVLSVDLRRSMGRSAVQLFINGNKVVIMIYKYTIIMYLFALHFTTALEPLHR